MVVKFVRGDSKSLVIADWRAYDVSLEEEMDEWCWQTFSYHPRTGMVLTFKTEADMNIFLLAWS
jgi:hypothetical protein